MHMHAQRAGRHGFGENIGESFPTSPDSGTLVGIEALSYYCATVAFSLDLTVYTVHR